MIVEPFKHSPLDLLVCHHSVNKGQVLSTVIHQPHVISDRDLSPDEGIMCTRYLGQRLYGLGDPTGYARTVSPLLN